MIAAKPNVTKRKKRNGERAALQQEWERLRREHKNLLAETRRLRSSDDLNAMRTHQARLLEHEDRLAAWARAMEFFHGSHGPVGLDRDC